MKSINYYGYYLLKFGKGILAIFIINFILFSAVSFLNSCKKVDNVNPNFSKTNKEFLKALELNVRKIGTISIYNKHNKSLSQIHTKSDSDGQSTSYQPIYLEFPSDVDSETEYMFINTSTIQDLSTLISYTDARIQYEPSETNLYYQLDVPIQSVSNSINPLILDAKEYLYNKGLTEQDIQEMIVNEGGTEEDLIPYVMTLSHIENNQSIANNFSFFFTNNAYAMNEYVRCAMVAIGADVLMNLGSSAASSWSKFAIKKAFGAVAKRALGPIGVAIAIVSFTLCMNE
ncbi:hypothetical protein SDC9_93313 [bioreactor metagenome]|uniref:Uncharacterized protein n=1 Tax=bioreactor metagenome TaxID=1076179 RepID=A0A645A1J6_9ZZZZ